ncbi:hypothetical protein PUMCH_002377 [Australozyma saopauloensis]|uniref:Probable transporter MCH1 n=1 Tax=Australozyma saopauloensis TaxID=291208 RepID=A0AAX4H934_9ASCO|nr:hypothetical protein PUMCH_002377 [[Candida] saopauloensis]
MKSVINRISHRIRNYLAARHDLKHLKALAFGIALMSCLSLGSIMLFSLFALALHNSVGLSYTEINLIVSLSAVGMYLCLPGLGYLADCHGPALLSLISIWAFCPAYFVNSTIVKFVAEGEQTLTPLSIFMMAVSFCFIGLATSSLYFSSLLTCAKIYPNYRSLAISLPVTCYGVSSLIGAQLLKLQYFHQKSGVLDLYKVFRFFSVLYFVVGILNFVSNSIVSIEQEVIFGDEEPLLSSSEQSSLQGSESCLPDEALTPQRSMIEPINHHERYVAFLKDKSAWLFLVSFFFCVGPMESFQNNLGLIIASTTGNSANLENQVSVVAALSTVIRLFVGVAADWVSSPSRKYRLSKVWLLIILATIGAIGQLGPMIGLDFTTVSIFNGVTYGGVFTTYPTIITSIWGVDIMGSTWGSFMVAPALGSISFSLLHGAQMDRCPSDIGIGGNNGCLNDYFKVTGASLVASIVCIMIVWRFFWIKRGITSL